MASVASKSFVTRVRYPTDKKESAIEKVRRQFYELEKRCDKYFDDLDNVEDLCKQAKEDMKRFHLKAKAEKEIAKSDAHIHARLFSALTDTNEKMKKAKGEDLKPAKQKIPEAARRTLLSTTGGQARRYIKIGCAFFLDAVAAYGLFKVTQPYFF